MKPVEPIATLIVLTLLTSSAMAQPPAPDPSSDKERAEATLKLANEKASQIVFRLADDRKTKLNLHPRSLLRWSNPVVLDGAIFTFVQGTNPEVLLLLEARQAGDKHEWQYALVRFNSVAMRAFRNERQVWSVPQVAPPWQDVRDPSKVYFVSMLAPGE